MKVSVNSTFSYIKFNLNYGSALQCFALQRELKKRGHDVSLVRDYRANPVIILKRLRNIRYIKCFLQKAKAQIKLQGFIRRNITLSERAYVSYKGLVKNCPVADCHIVGSDQVWHNANNFRYLSYVPEDKIKISYAASFGKPEITGDMQRAIAPHLERFDGISVREAAGVKILEKMGFAAEHALDPTLLLECDEYPYKEVAKENYCYGYFLNVNKREDIPMRCLAELCESAGKELLLTAPINYPMFLEFKPLFPSVEEWLGLYKKADCIFTNTYHGLLFCIIFRKRFVLFLQQGETAAENDRFYSLMEKLGLRERVATAQDTQRIERLMHEDIDYDRVYEVIEKERQRAREFLSRFGL